MCGILLCVVGKLIDNQSKKKTFLPRSLDWIELWSFVFFSQNNQPLTTLISTVQNLSSLWIILSPFRKISISSQTKHSIKTENGDKIIFHLTVHTQQRRLDVYRTYRTQYNLTQTTCHINSNNTHKILYEPFYPRPFFGRYVSSLLHQLSENFHFGNIAKTPLIPPRPYVYNVPPKYNTNSRGRT